jgi:hypothetical protein
MKRALAWLGILLLLSGVAWFGWKKSGPPPAPAPAAPVDLAKHDGQTIDFSSGQPVVKNAAADQAAIAKAVKEMEAAAKSVTFGPPEKKPEPKK